MSTENNNELTVKEQIAEDFAKAFQGKMEQSLLDEAVTKIKDTQPSYAASGSIITALVYTNVHIEMSEMHKVFTGHGGGVFSTGGGALIGSIYTDDLDKLFRDTVSFEVNSTVVYCSVIFFDKHSHTLGSFQAGAVSVSIGVGGGTGSWS